MTMLAIGVAFSLAPNLRAQTTSDKRPYILVIWGDDIGIGNISHNNRGMMGYQTPNIDRIAREGVGSTDYYAQQSCTAGRAAFIGGTVPVRTGMTKVGLPGAKEGWQEQDITIAAVLKEQGYATGQFGKNHFGDRDEHLPTNHGFDEFFGNLYHLNAEEEPEHRDYPGDFVLPSGKTFRETFGPRGVLKSKAMPSGTQPIEDTGPLTKKRMETIDEETVAAAKDFIKRQHESGKPFFCWWNGTRMHFRTYLYTHNYLFRMRRLGLQPGKTFDASKLDEATVDAINTAAKEALEDLRQIVFEGKLGVVEDGWNYSLDLGSYGTNYRLRKVR